MGDSYKTHMNIPENYIPVKTGKSDFEFVKPNQFLIGFICTLFIVGPLIGIAVWLDLKEDKKKEVEKSLMQTNYARLHKQYETLFYATLMFLQNTNASSMTLSNDGSFSVKVDSKKIFGQSYTNYMDLNSVTFQKQ